MPERFQVGYFYLRCLFSHLHVFRLPCQRSYHRPSSSLQTSIPTHACHSAINLSCETGRHWQDRSALSQSELSRVGYLVQPPLPVVPWGKSHANALTGRTVRCTVTLMYAQLELTQLRIKVSLSHATTVSSSSLRPRDRGMDNAMIHDHDGTFSTSRNVFVCTIIRFNPLS